MNNAPTRFPPPGGGGLVNIGQASTHFAFFRHVDDTVFVNSDKLELITKKVKPGPYWNLPSLSNNELQNKHNARPA